MPPLLLAETLSMTSGTVKRELMSIVSLPDDEELMAVLGYPPIW